MNNRVRTIKRYYDKHPGEYDYEAGQVIVYMSSPISAFEAWDLLMWLMKMKNRKRVNA